METDIATDDTPLRRRLAGLFVLAVLLSAPITLRSALAAPAATTPPADELLVYAAASLTDVLQKIGADYTRQNGTVVKFSFGATSILARQIESGARPDVFISADEAWMDYVDQRQLVVHESRIDLLGNRLVLIAPKDSAVELRIAPGFKLRAALGAGRLSVADPSAVPAGRYAKAALTQLGVWDSVAARLATSENVRTALLYVARGEAPLGIVYATDAKVEPKVRVVDTFAEDLHPPIRYPAAVTTGAKPQAANFLAWLEGSGARAHFVAAGFEVRRDDAADSEPQPEIASRSR